MLSAPTGFLLGLHFNPEDGVICCPEMSGADKTQNQIFLTNAGVNTNIKLNKNKNPCLGRFNMKPG
jgi:hypothetical protein